MKNTKEKIKTVEDLAGFLRITKSSVYKLTQEDRIPCQKVGRHWRFHRGAIEHWLAREGELFPREPSSLKKY